MLASIDPLLNDQTLYQRTSERSELGKFQMAIISTDASKRSYIINNYDTIKTTPSTDEKNSIESEDDQLLIDNIFAGVLKGDLNLD